MFTNKNYKTIQIVAAEINHEYKTFYALHYMGLSITTKFTLNFRSGLQFSQF